VIYSATDGGKLRTIIKINYELWRRRSVIKFISLLISFVV